ncbi:MAG: hypothetical protein RLZZ444_3139, partial [Pseudomonadota bacterium]
MRMGGKAITSAVSALFVFLCLVQSVWALERQALRIESEGVVKARYQVELARTSDERMKG